MLVIILLGFGILEVDNISGESPILCDVPVDLIILIEIKGVLIVVAEGAFSCGFFQGHLSLLIFYIDLLFGPDVVVLLVPRLVLQVVNFHNIHYA